MNHVYLIHGECLHVPPHYNGRRIIGCLCIARQLQPYALTINHAMSQPKSIKELILH